jgi:predicted nucleotidyltransferase
MVSTMAWSDGFSHSLTRGARLLGQAVALIRAHRPIAAVTDYSPVSPDTESSIIAALRARLTAKDHQIAQLRAALRERDHTIATLHGEADTGRHRLAPRTRKPPR